MRNLSNERTKYMNILFHYNVVSNTIKEDMYRALDKGWKVWEWLPVNDI